MTVNCLWELQKAVFAALDGDGTISGLVTGVYSHVPQGTAFPYIKLGEMISGNWSTKTTSGISGDLRLEVYARDRGSKDVLEITNEITRVLDGASLSMTGCTMVAMNFLGQDVELMSDGLTWRGEIRFNALVEVG